MKYDQLVRDKLPEMLQRKGKIVKFHEAKISEIKKHLHEKLKEEVSEFLKDGSPEELVDVLEIAYAIAEYNGISEDKLDSMRRKKTEYKGKFDKYIILDEVKD